MAKDIRLTDHAVRRYVERVLGISDSELLAMMVPESVRMSIKAHGDGKYAISGSHEIVIEKGLVLTVTRNCGKREGDKRTAIGK